MTVNPLANFLTVTCFSNVARSWAAAEAEPVAESTLRLEEKGEPVTEHTTSFWGDAWRRFRRNKLAVAGLIIVMLIVLLAAGASILAPQGSNTFNGLQAYRFPSWEHLFGTDDRGREERK